MQLIPVPRYTAFSLSILECGHACAVAGRSLPPWFTEAALDWGIYCRPCRKLRRVLKEEAADA